MKQEMQMLRNLVTRLENDVANHKLMKESGPFVYTGFKSKCERDIMMIRELLMEIRREL